jgi:hypothetical protein
VGGSETSGKMVMTNIGPSAVAADEDQFENANATPIIGFLLSAVFSDGTMRYSQGFLSSDELGFKSWKEYPGNGITKNEMSVAAISDNIMAVFHRGTDSNLYYNFAEIFQAGPLLVNSSWTEDPGHGQSVHGPAALGLLNSNNVMLSVQGLDNRVWEEILSHNSPNAFSVTTQWHSVVNGGNDSRDFTNNAVGLGYLMGTNESLSPAIVAPMSPEGNLIIRIQ